MRPMYQYAAKVLNVVDGDTLDLEIDLGFRTRLEIRCRVWGVNCPEVKGDSKVQGMAATHFTREMIRGFVSVMVRTHKDSDSFGRYVAEVIGTRQDGTVLNLGDELIKNGHAVEFMRK
jgi:micrococcal nuclease